MWHSPYAKRRAATASKKRNKLRLTLQRVQAELKVSNGTQISGGARGQVIAARLVLNDFGPKGIGAYSPEPVMVGQEVAVTIEKPTRFYCKGRVIWCQLEESHIISQAPFQYRMGIEFIFGSDDEKRAVEDYCKDLSASHMFKKQAA
ncbi:MAG: PilZ domain-containing protein [Bdellovibrionales bacterium]|nr:PilZ domain-containing protein [Bdellovibrionales bacterium]